MLAINESLAPAVFQLPSYSSSSSSPATTCLEPDTAPCAQGVRDQRLRHASFTALEHHFPADNCPCPIPFDIVMATLATLGGKP